MTCRYPLMPPMAVPGDPATQTGWHYGDPINSFNYTADYGDELCRLVSSCLAVRPIDRPTLQQLEIDVDNLRPPELTEADRAWLVRYLRTPSRPRAGSLLRAFL
jgi:hypothetical protein